MKINFKLRLKNKVTLVALVAVIAPFIYQVLGIFDIVPKISEGDVEQFLGLLINFLAILGVVADPTTAGMKDTDLAMAYNKPRKETDVYPDEEVM